MANSDVINARPSKALFIEMLTKDIPLIRAILDLVDNSVDGARRMRSDEDFSGLWIKIDISKNRFRIADNCGGMSVATAREYAFRFGRADDAPETPGSVGQFGVGMKRAFFKLGKFFSVESKTKNNSFVVEVDVDEWEKTEEWVFHFKEFDEKTKNPSDTIGTTILVESLHENVSENFGQDNFRTRLSQELATAHLLSINKGLQMSLNGIPLQMRDLSLYMSKQIKPVLKKIEYKVKNHPDPVDVEIIAGIADSSPKDAGWFVFCNGRLLLERDKTPITGWGEKDGGKIPLYHQQYARFRGYVFFNSDYAELLPWNTTKTGVDTDSPIYQSVRLEMVSIMRPIIDFLNELKESKGENDERDSPLEKIVTATKTFKIEEIDSFAKTFETPKYKKTEKTAETIPIQYRVPKKQAEIVKKSLGAKSWREVGEMTFEYYLKQEGDE
ncbi:MAG: ATP-binding protein [Anaerolineales bacterium]|nr:ATP-binding protein [Anaerolineales bacterium]